MNIVDRLTNRKGEAEEPAEVRARRDVLFSRLRLEHPEYGPENIDLSEVDFRLDDEETRAAVAKQLDITSEERIAAIDLDEIISFSGEHRRRARRAYIRSQERRRRKGQSRFRAQQRQRRFAEGRPSNHEVILLRREAAATAAALRQQAADEAAQRQVAGSR